MKKFALLLLVMAAVLAGGCGVNKNGSAEPEETVRLVASEPTLPPDFEQMSSAQKTRGFLAVSVMETNAFGKAWSDYDMAGGRPEVDFQEDAVYFISMQESGSCPYVPETFETSEHPGELSVRFAPLAEVCTADLAPRTFVIAVKKELAKELTAVRLYLQQQEVSVPLLGMQVDY